MGTFSISLALAAMAMVRLSSRFSVDFLLSSVTGATIGSSFSASGGLLSSCRERRRELYVNPGFKGS